jgi:hypothetical protein
MIYNQIIYKNKMPRRYSYSDDDIMPTCIITRGKRPDPKDTESLLSDSESLSSDSSSSSDDDIMMNRIVKKINSDYKYTPQDIEDAKRSLLLISEDKRNKEICLLAVKSNGYSLEYVPDKLRDREICLEAVKSNGDCLYRVPEKLRDREMCLEAVKADIFKSLNLKYV